MLLSTTRWWLATAPALIGVALLAATSVGAAPTNSIAQATQAPAPCAPPTTASILPVTPTTIGTIEQLYDCVFAHYYGGATLDDRLLLTGAFAGLTQELDRLGLDQPQATLPALTGNRATDWAAFSAVYKRIETALPERTALRQALAAATIDAMLANLTDNHVHWQHLLLPPGYQPGDNYGFGFTTAPIAPLATAAPGEALPPLFLSSVTGPAATAGLASGDVIEDVNGAPPFVDGVVSTGVITLLNPSYPSDTPVVLTVDRPATGRTWNVTLRPALFTPLPLVTSKLAAPGIAEVTMGEFAPGTAGQVLAAIAALRANGPLHGLVLDLRGNGGGSPTEVQQLISAFVHGRNWSYDCTATGACTANHTDDSVPLLHVPLVVLTDRGCVSACDAFAAAVKDLHAGVLVGTRTAGVVSGPAQGYQLNDNSLLVLPAKHELGPDHEVINGIGVAPDYYLPTTAADYSTGPDPDLSKARTLLDSQQPR
jgi:carboxyl-terminal processing protease